MAVEIVVMADAGNSFRLAKSISPRPALINIRDSLNTRDRDDYYRFSLRSTASFDAFVSGIQRGSNFDVFLYTGNQRLVRRSIRPGNANEAINLNLTRGTWYLRVQWKTGSSAYNLRFSANPERAGSTFPTARLIGGLPAATPVTVSDYVGTSDRTDIYRFRVSNYTRLTTTLTPLASTANFRLYNARGNVLGGTNATGTTARTLARNLLPGLYYVGVNAGGAAVRYSLRFLNSPIADTAGNDTASAKVLPVSFAPGTYSEFVGVGDAADIYKFDTTTSGDLNLRLTGVQSNTSLKIDLLTNNGIYAGVTSSSVNGVETLTAEGLSAGTYYFQVRPDPTTVSSTYTLNYQLIPPDNVGDTQVEATQITSPGTSPFPVLGPTTGNYRDFAGGSDEDWYKFDFTNQANNFLSIRLTELASDLNMEFFKEGSTNRIFTSSGGAGQGVFEGSVGAGIYYLRVYAPNVNTGSTYNLQMSVDSGNSRPTITRDIFPDGDSGARLLQEVRTLSTLFFVASDGEELGLWRTDGALDTTIRVGVFDSISRLQSVGNTLYIAGDLAGDSFGSELYKWTPVASNDPNEALVGQISLVRDLTTGTDPNNNNLPRGTSIDGMTAVGNYLYFLASPSGLPQDRSLWRTDGTTGGTVQIQNAGNSFAELTVVGNALYYQASGATLNGTVNNSAIVLWQIANAATGSTAAAPIFAEGAGTVLRGVSTLRAIGNDLYFVASNFDGTQQFNREWRRLSGSTLTTLDANGDLNDGSLVGVQGDNLTLAVVNGFTYFTANAGNGIELFRQSLTGGAITEIEINSIDPGEGGNPSSLTVYNNQLFFRAAGADDDVELYVINSPGAATPTVTKVDLFSGTTNSSNPRDFRVAGGKLYFVATGTSGTEVYSYDGVGSSTSVANYTLAFDIAPGATGSEPLNLVVVGDSAGDGSQGRIFFTADDGTSGREVWVI